jgi:ATP-dependent DNA helicase RecG
MIELTNPGSLLEGLELKDLGSGLSTLRNPIIAKGFRELGMLESWGTGIQSAQTWIQEASLPPARFQLKGFFFQVSSIWRWSETLDEVEQKVLSIVTKNGHSTSTEVAATIGLTDRSIRRILADLVKRGYLKKTGTTRDASYRLG